MFLALVSGGIDSPVAAKLAGERERIELLHFNLYPYYCQGAFELVLQALKKLGKYAWIVPWGEFLREAIRSRGYQCLICRAGMYWVGSRLAKRLGCRGLVTGESLGQKASQTLKNLWAVSGFSCLPVLRPLLALEKEEIIELSRRLGLWQEVHAGCCRAVPKKPVVAASPERLIKIWKELGLEAVAKAALRKAKKVELEGLELSDLL